MAQPDRPLSLIFQASQQSAIKYFMTLSRGVSKKTGQIQQCVIFFAFCSVSGSSSQMHLISLYVLVLIIFLLKN
jgi:hypothetical protein